MALLRNPKKFRKNAAKQQGAEPQAAEPQNKTKRLSALAAGGVLALVLITLFLISSAQKRADNIASALDPAVLKGLAVDADYDPSAGRRYVQVSEGQDRNVIVPELGTTLPVISRYNYRAMTPKRYEIIGEAPYALTINVSSNISDPDLLRYLFNQQSTVDGFLRRPDVAPLLEDPAALAALAANQAKLNAFFSDGTVQQALASPEVVSALAGSRLFAHLLISKAVKYYRDRPAEAAKLINASPALAALKKNAAVRKAVTENVYLKDIAATLLK